ncbi:DUF1840 domain-containing protein [Nitrosospira sp. NpAV]|uniref:DUF1840 domain-containing protein n=1 Tax=Nitrosospira sp. NpAV TaxID=58133 RepID=UPI0005A0089E|nr:DUF1840 domain-containing protein [Nitrosospira sp. NpAV]KIO48876.1 hypothetical protein SQ11_08795 [Nitrosospira sp. NpAV]
MLVTFKCDAYADITLFGDIALRLLKMMGHSGTVPGAILAEDIPTTLDRLKRAIETEKWSAPAPPEPARDAQSEGEDDEDVALEYRALPLIELLSAAAKKNCNVMWQKT